MSVEYTLSILKPDAVERNITGKVNAMIENSGLEIAAQKMLHLTQEQAEGFYAVHSQRPFFSSLVKSMTSGPVVVQVLKGENAVSRYRDVMGATNPADAAEGTIRKEFSVDIEANTVHGSDSLENAANEISFFFTESEIVR
jgi:nucleoside-diphosphate kinase